MRLGEILVEMGACGAHRVREGLEDQVIFGGRLGTNLLEIGAVTEETLAGALSRQHGRPALHGDIPIDPRLAAMLRPEHADRFEVVPYRIEGRRLSVLCCDPADLKKLDEVAFVLGKQVAPVIVPEARLWALLRSHYGVERPTRGLALDWTRVRREISLPAEQAPARADLMGESEFEALYTGRPPPGAGGGGLGPKPGASSAPHPILPPALAGSPHHAPATRTPAARRAAGAWTAEPGDPFGGALVSSDEVLASLQAEATAERESRWIHSASSSTAAPPQAPRSLTALRPTRCGPAMGSAACSLTATAGAVAAMVPAPLSFAEAAAALSGVHDRGAIARIVLRYARSRFRRAILFTVHARAADGWEGIGDGLTPQRVARLHVPLGKPSVVKTVVESRSHFLGPLARTEANIRLLRELAGGAPKNAFAMPILARGRVVNVLYADGGRGGLVSSDGVGELLILAARISQSYDVLLRRAP